MRRLASAVLIGALLTSCGDKDPLSPEDVSGLYTLVSLNGGAIPASVIVTDQVDTSVTTTVTYTAGSVCLNADNTYSTSIAFEFVSNPGGLRQETSTDSGTFELVEPATIRFTSSEGEEPGSGTLNGNRLTMIVDATSSAGIVFTLVFEK